MFPSCEVAHIGGKILVGPDGAGPSPDHPNETALEGLELLLLPVFGRETEEVLLVQIGY